MHRHRAQAFGCKRCIVAGALLRLSTRFLLLWGRTLAAMQFMQVCFGAGVASEVVFNAYVFTLVVGSLRAPCALSQRIKDPPWLRADGLRKLQGPELYQSAASATAAAALLGFLVAAEAGQLAVAGGASLTALFYASLVTVARARCSGSCCSALTLATLQGSGTALSFLLHADAPPPLPPDAPPLAQRTKQARLRSPLAIAML